MHKKGSERLKNIRKGILAGVFGAAGAYIAAVRIFFNMAAGRKSHIFQTQTEEKNRWAPELIEGIQWARKQHCKELEIISFDGLRLRGRLIKPKKPKRMIVLFHGWRGSWQHDFGAVLRWLYDIECSILITEQRAQGRSEGEYMGFGIQERKDCLEWLKWIDRNESIDIPVYLYGVSMGAATVLMASGERLPHFVKGVIADCGFSSAYDMILNYGKQKMKIREFPVMYSLNRLFRKKAGYDLKECSPKEAVKHCKVPVLFIHGTADSFVPYKMSEENYTACRAKKQLLLVGGAAHCGSYLADRKKYEETVEAFFHWKD